MIKSLDVEAVRLFLLVAELKSFSHAGDSLGLSQSAVSLKIKRLEDLVGRRLFDRTPRHVRLSADGDRFLEPARNFLSAHSAAIESFERSTFRLVLGISHHIVGAELPSLLRHLGDANPGLVPEVRIAASRDIFDAFNRGLLDVAVVLGHDRAAPAGLPVMRETFGWMAAAEMGFPADGPLPLVSQSEWCSVRAMAIKALDGAGVAWCDAFIGGGVATVGAAVAAGLGVAALSRQAAPLGLIDIGPKFGLPELPSLDIQLFSNAQDDRTKSIITSLVAVLRASRQTNRARGRQHRATFPRASRVTVDPERRSPGQSR